MKDNNSYTLDELKSKVEEFKDYLLKVSNKNKCNLSVEATTWSESFDETGNVVEHRVESHIIIR